MRTRLLASSLLLVAAAVHATPGDSIVAAEASRHWAFAPPSRPPLPAVRDAATVRNPIDRFVVARLEADGLRPAPEADRATLLRRLSLDLVGLPPSLAALDAFLADTRPDAYERQVDRLLASPHYGERWGAHWLDAARYADSDGFEKDKPREVWFYRDWVIDALNRDLPYDRFVVEQIAGDLLPGAGQRELVATGFLRNSMVNEEGGVDPEQFRMEAMFDRMDAVGKSVLGLTIQCAQCHDHKYDPLTQREYYELFAFLNNCHEASATVYPPAATQKRAEIFAQIRAIETDLKHRHPDWRARMAAWEETAHAAAGSWTVVRPEVDELSTGGQKYLEQADGSFLAQGYAPTKHTVRMTVQTELETITGFRLELLPDPDLPHGGPGRSIWGTGALTEFEVETAPAAEPGRRARVRIAAATADIELAERPLDAIFDDRSKKRRVTGPVAFAIDGDGLTAWGIDAGPGRRNQARKAVFVPEQPISHDGGAVLTFGLQQNHGGWNSDDNQNHNLGRFRLSVTSDRDPAADPVPAAVRAILATPPEVRTAAEEARVFSYWRTRVPEWQGENARIEALWEEHPEGASQLVLAARGAARTTHLLRRGDFLSPEVAVRPGVPAFLHELASETSDSGDAPPRLAFARWLVDRDSPTTARAIVNRVWQHYFGVGLVGTSEDLGVRSPEPSHAGLFDWLAVELMERGWRLKELHRLIVGSATYRQISRDREELYTRDPDNRLLARGPRVRVEGEVVRDIALSVSGLLVPAVGGPSVYPPLPGFLLLPPVSYGPKTWGDGDGDSDSDSDSDGKGSGRYRRALYIFKYRSLPYPVLQTFDVPNGDFSCVRRARSNTPLQALVTLNEPVFVECAEALARRILAEGGEDARERVEYAFRLCLSRAPTDGEAAELLRLLSDVRQGPPAPARELAPWTAVARVLLNLDETITKE